MLNSAKRGLKFFTPNNSVNYIKMYSSLLILNYNLRQISCTFYVHFRISLTFDRYNINALLMKLRNVLYTVINVGIFSRATRTTY